MNRTPGLGRNYYLLLSGYFISGIGNWFYQVALPLLVYELTNSVFSMAVTYGLTYLPYVLFLPLGGVLADRLERRRVLIGGDISAAAVVGLLALCVWQEFNSMWVIYPAVFTLAAVTPFYHPAFQGLVPSVVDKQQLAKGNAWLQAAENAAALVGPLIGGASIVALGTTSVLVLDAASFLTSALLLRMLIVRQQPSRAASVSLIQDLREGFSYVWANPVIRCGSTLFFGTNFAITVFQANYAYFLVEVLHLNAWQIGIAFTIAGVGTIAGALVAPQLGKHFRPGILIVGSTVVAGLMTLPLLVGHDVLTVAIPWGITTALGTVNVVTWFTLRQRVVPAHLLGRVVALTRLIAFGSIPLAAVVGGAILSFTGNMYVIIAITALVRIALGCIGFLTLRYNCGVAIACADPGRVGEVVDPV